MIAGFLTFTGIMFWICAIVWATDELLRRHTDRRPPVEDRDDWGTR